MRLSVSIAVVMIRGALGVSRPPRGAGAHRSVTGFYIMTEHTRGMADDRGWNIIGGKARSGLVASLLGGSRSGESSLLAWVVAAALVAVAIFVL